MKLMINALIWDDWNREHITKHKVTSGEIEEVCHGHHQVFESYRKRILIIGETKKGKTLVVVLSPEDRNLRSYEEGKYYVITAFEREAKQ